VDLKETPVIFIDADDTLWENEGSFREAEEQFASLLSPYAHLEGVRDMLWRKQETNIPYFGYGSKTYFIAMTDSALDLCGGTLPREVFDGIRQIIIDLTLHPVELIDGVEETLEYLSSGHRLILASKGDSVEQMRKVKDSGLEKYFFCSEIMRNKNEEDYLDLAAKFSVKPSDIVMVGNSSRSDILPVINVGGTAVFIPHHIVWDHEVVALPESDRIIYLQKFAELRNFF